MLALCALGVFAYAARDLDYNLVIVSDACTSRTRSTHDLLMQQVFPRLAWVRNAQEVVALLSSGADAARNGVNAQGA